MLQAWVQPAQALVEDLTSAMNFAEGHMYTLAVEARDWAIWRALFDACFFVSFFCFFWRLCFGTYL
jgi:hypothetical protein